MVIMLKTTTLIKYTMSTNSIVPQFFNFMPIRVLIAPPLNLSL